jgi:hypothetical protein
MFTIVFLYPKRVDGFNGELNFNILQAGGAVKPLLAKMVDKPRV